MKVHKLLYLLCLFTLCSPSLALAGEPSNNSNEWIVPKQYIVDFEDDVDRDEIEDVLDDYSLQYYDGPLWDEMKMEIVTISDPKIIDSIDDSEDIEGVEPLTMLYVLGEPNDPLYSKQWHMQRVNVESAWSYSVGRGVTVAVIDTGIACDDHGHFHKVSDLNQTECVPGYNFVDKNEHANDDHGHGTHVAGTIAQSTNNGIGGVGIAFGAKLMPVKVLSGSGSGTSAGVAAGIHWAADNGAQVLNLSLGGPMPSGVIKRAVNYARKQGAIVIAAAGNNGAKVGYPAGYPGVIAVSATDNNDKLASFSSRGPEITIAAPGVEVVQNTICDDGRNECEEFPAWRGTSMASPHVAGVAALFVGMGVTNPDDIEHHLTSTAKKISNSEESHLYGAGLVQADGVKDLYLKQLGVRGLFLVVFAMLAAAFARRKGDSYSLKSKAFWLAGLTTSVGLLFFVPFIWNRAHLAVDMLSRPVGDWPMLLNASWQQYLPLANIFAPLTCAALFLKLHRGAGKWLSGLFVGTAAYLGSVLWMGNMALPFGILGTIWCVVNAMLCVYVGGVLLLKIKE